MFSRIDIWVGKHLFVPPIIRLCQLLGWSNHRLSNYALFFGGLCALHESGTAGTWAGYVIAGLLVLIMIPLTLSVGLRPDGPGSKGFLWLRVPGFFLMLLEFVAVATGEHPLTPGTFVWPLLLTANYAAMIDHVPPRERKAKKAKLAKANT